MKFDKLANAYMKVLTEGASKGYSLYWKDEEYKRTRKWYTASTPEKLLQLINHDNLTGNFEYGMVDEDHEFKSFQELLDFCSHSDFFITGPDGRIISGMYMKDEEVGPEEAAEERKETSQEWELKRHASEQNKWDKRKERWDAFKKANPNYKKKVSEIL